MKSVLPRLAEFGAEGDDGDGRSHPHKRHCNRVGSRRIKLRGWGSSAPGTGWALTIIALSSAPQAQGARATVGGVFTQYH